MFFLFLFFGVFFKLQFFCPAATENPLRLLRLYAQKSFDLVALAFL